MMLSLFNTARAALEGARAIDALARAVRAIMPTFKRPASPSPWLAGSTHRWHTNPVFAATGDRVDGHSARVAILILQFKPGACAALLRAAIIHDLGESAVGDMASPIKRNHPDLYAQLERIEADALSAMGLGGLGLHPFDRALLKLCDGLDAYLWARSHRPDYVAAHPEWRAMFARLRRDARSLGVGDKFSEIVSGVCDGKF